LNRITIGYFGSSYGVKGWLKIYALNQPLSNLLNFSKLETFHQGRWQEIEITEGKTQGKTVVVKLATCDTPEVAKTFSNNPITVSHEQLPKLLPGEYYWADLIGLQVINEQNVRLGSIDHLLETGSNDVMVLTGEKKRLIPYTHFVVKSVDLINKTMIVDWDPDF
jgi:16S rRNA processing protein RimM